MSDLAAKISNWQAEHEMVLGVEMVDPAFSKGTQWETNVFGGLLF